ncbi:MAG: hypothetical protein ACJ77K_15730 [Bacteroidia bacterium]
MTKNTANWPVAKKFIFLVLAAYSFFYIFPFPLDAVPQLDFLTNPYGRLHDAFVYRAAKSIFHITGAHKVAFSDSGDTIFDFCSVFIYGLLSLIIALAVTLADQGRTDYEKLKRWLFLYIRYAIAFYMLVYGFDKVFKSHFPFPSFEKLEQPLGQSSPQGLLWAFMGYSSPYSIYLGIIEVLSGFLLFFRRTTALGAFLTLVIMINVTIINFSYDVPVKLFALHMVVYAIILSAPYLRSVWQFFILNKTSALPQIMSPEFPAFILPYKKWIKLIVIGSYTFLFMSFSIANMKKDGDSAPTPPLYGIYRTQAVERLSSDPNKLEPGYLFGEIIFDKKNAVISNTYFETVIDTAQKQFLLISNSQRDKMYLWHYELNGQALRLTGRYATLNLSRVPEDSFPLINRGFHWIVQYPYNN